MNITGIRGQKNLIQTQEITYGLSWLDIKKSIPVKDMSRAHIDNCIRNLTTPQEIMFYERVRLDENETLNDWIIKWVNIFKNELKSRSDDLPF